MASKQVLITGGSGFIGTHLARELSSAGHEVRVFDRDPGTDPRAWLGDIRSRHELRQALKGIEVVFHFAASAGEPRSMSDIRQSVENSSLGTLQLLELLAEMRVEKLILGSSMSIYGEGLCRSEDGTLFQRVMRSREDLEQGRFELMDSAGNVLEPIATPEEKVPDLRSVEALSKYDQERLCLLLAQTHDIPTVILRFFNVYGRGLNVSSPYAGPMAGFAAQVLRDQSPVLTEDGRQRRDFIHVSDAVQACRLAMVMPEAEGMAFNIASGRNYEWIEIAERIASAMGRGHLRPLTTGGFRMSEVRHCFADISLARRVLGFEPRVTLSDGLPEFAKWFKEKAA